MTVAISAQHPGGWTGAVLGVRTRDERTSGSEAGHSMLDERLLGPNMREILPLWDQALAPTTAVPIFGADGDFIADAGAIIMRVAVEGTHAPIWLLHTQAAAKSASQLVVRQLNQIRDVLDIPIRDVCKAAGIPRRTYYSWTKTAPKNRLQADARIEELRITVEELRALLGSELRIWVREARQMDLLRRGQFNDLLNEAVTWRARTHPLDADSDWANATAVDWPEPDPTPSDEPPKPRVRYQSSSRIQTTRRDRRTEEV